LKDYVAHFFRWRMSKPAYNSRLRRFLTRGFPLTLFDLGLRGRLMLWPSLRNVANVPKAPRAGTGDNGQHTGSFGSPDASNLGWRP
jgi:hypothetical protein